MAEMKTYLVTLLDAISFEEKKILVQSECSCDMQEFVNTLDLGMQRPLVMNIDDRAAKHIPVAEPEPH